MPIPASGTRGARATGTAAATGTTTLSRAASTRGPNNSSTAKLAGRTRAASQSQTQPPARAQAQAQAQIQESGSGRSAGGSSDIAKTTLFVTNLRLLELDQIPSWPAITSKSLAGSDQKARIAAVEWALYHLFQIYDEEETCNKLLPFFPPLEPLQSLNLRAALLRCLTELKRTGRLGKDVVLRKTMLDECKGELLEDLLLVFSSLVLKKRVQEAPLDMSIALRLATAERLRQEDIACLQPLIIAHKASLSKTIRVKNQLGEQYAEFCNLLDSQQESLQKLEEDVRDASKTLPERSTLVKSKEDRLRDMWQLNWMGDKQLLKQILRGNIEKDPSKDLLSQPFDSLIGGVRNGRTSLILAQGGQRDRPKQLCDELETKLKLQEKRLRAIKGLQTELETRKGKLAAQVASTKQPAQRTEELKFTAHTTLTLDSLSKKVPTKAGGEATLQDRIDDLASKEGGQHYADELENMLTDMRRAGLSRKQPNPATGRNNSRPVLAHSRTSSKSLMEKRSASPDYTALLNTKSRDPTSDKSLRATKEEVGELKHSAFDDVQRTDKPEQKSKAETEQKIMFETEPKSRAETKQQRLSIGVSPASPMPASKPALEVIQSSSPESSSSEDSSVSGSSPEEKSPGELTSKGSDIYSPSSPGSTKIDPAHLVEDKTQDPFVTSSISARPPASLAERTRMTLSSLGPLPPSSPPRTAVAKPQNKDAARRDTLQVPTPQSRASISSDEGRDGVQHRDQESLLPGQRTPKEEVFSSTDYASVFKSRPRLAHSPAFELREEDTLPNIDDSFTLTDAGAGEESSPLARMQQRRL